MTLEGFSVAPVTPWETASGGKAAVCGQARKCSSTYRHTGDAGVYDVVVQYFDENDGAATFRLLIADREVATWVAEADLPTKDPNGHSSTRRVLRGVRLAAGDVIRIEVAADGEEGGAIDYVEIV